MPGERIPIAVIGAGPAGAAAALGLTRLGYRVAVVRVPAARARRESFSARVVEALRVLELREALAAIEPPGSRIVRWAGEARELAGEAQVERAAFDAGLAADLVAHGVRVVGNEARRVALHAEGARVELASGEALDAELVIDARGRSAPGGGPRERGPETTCLVQRWRGASRPPRTAVVSLADGWLWLADDGRGGLTTQLALDASDAPPRAALASRLGQALHGDASARELLGEIEPDGEPFARAATPVLSDELAGERMLRVGDAALAVDPLSGNGVFQALSTALVAPAVANTLLRRPAQAALARSFYAERARDIFLRFALNSRAFYAQGAAHHGTPFWRARAAWPAPDAAPRRAAALAIQLRPVVCQGWIEEREVVVTPERPLGTWRVANVELAPIVRASLRGAQSESQALASIPSAARAPVAAWLRAHRGDVPSADRR